MDTDKLHDRMKMFGGTLFVVLGRSDGFLNPAQDQCLGDDSMKIDCPCITHNTKDERQEAPKQTNIHIIFRH